MVERSQWQQFRRRLAPTVHAVLVVGAAAFALGVLLAPDPPDPRTPEPLAIVGASVVDPEAGVVRPDQTVLLDGGKILRVGPSDAVEVPSGFRVVEAHGKFLIPGLWDMHVHWRSVIAPQLTMPLFIAHGVTGVRELGGAPDLETKRRWRHQIDTGELLGPRIVGYAAGFVASMDSVDTLDTMLDGLVEGPWEFLKVYNQLQPEHFTALLEAAQERGIEVVGHRPRAVSAIDAAEGGLRSIEHARLFLFESFPGAEELRQRYLGRYTGTDPGEGPILTTATRRAMLDEHSPEQFQAITAAMVEHGTWFCPTHLTRKMDAFADDETYRDDPRLRYQHFLQRFAWHRDADGMVEEDPTPEGRQTFMEFYLRGLELTGEAHRAGVRILAGTDANDTYVFPGSSLHDELQELVAAGLTPTEALRAATVSPAEYFGVTAEYGTVEPGKAADLVILHANPLEDIANTSKIHAVIYQGASYDRKALDGFLDAVEGYASSFPLTCKLLWHAFMD